MFNEEKRFKEAFLNLSKTDFYFVLVNDGSTDKTQDIIQALSKRCPKKITALTMAHNSGKAESVRQGMLYAYETFPDAAWIGFWDADFSAPIAEAPLMLRYAQNEDSDIVFGSRIKKIGSHIQRGLKRHFMGRFFCTAVDLLFQLNSYDSQCGAKFFRRKAIPDAFLEPFISKWIFDIEIILRVRQQFRVTEYPLRNWREVGGSKLNIYREAFRILLDIRKIYIQRKSKLSLIQQFVDGNSDLLP